MSSSTSWPTFYGREAALVFSTGYVANISTISGLLNRHDFVVLDKDAHNSLLTGAQLSGATMKRFGHNDLDRSSTRSWVSCPPRRARASSSTACIRWVATPRRSASSSRCAGRYPNTFLLDDEAHGLGVLGERGRGAAEHHGVVERRRPHHHHLLEDPRLVRRRAHRLSRRDRAAHARFRSADLHRVEHPRLARRRAAPRSACCENDPGMTSRLRGNVDLFVGPAHASAAFRSTRPRARSSPSRCVCATRCRP